MMYDIDRTTSDVLIFNDKQIFRYDQQTTSIIKIINLDSEVTAIFQEKGRYYVGTASGKIADINEQEYIFQDIGLDPILSIFSHQNQTYAGSNSEVYSFEYSNKTKASVLTIQGSTLYHKSSNSLYIANNSELSYYLIKNGVFEKVKSITINSVIKQLSSNTQNLVVLTQNSILIYNYQTLVFQSQIKKAYNMQKLFSLVNDKQHYFVVNSIKDNSLNFFNNTSQEFVFQIKSPVELQYYSIFSNQETQNCQLFYIYGKEMVQFGKLTFEVRQNQKMQIKLEQNILNITIQPPKIRQHIIHQDTIVDQDETAFDIPALEQALRQQDIEQVNICIQSLDTDIYSKMTNSGIQLLLDFLVSNLSPAGVIWLKSFIRTIKLTTKQQEAFMFSYMYYRQQSINILKIAQLKDLWGGQIGELEPIEEIEEW
ncbi:hypothetical protein SS50377_27493 [Spironucleus salmonicida]|uniref:Uncharacterized protein n=1 Tax=Spironucleus salmonicida TaxID=348837 RepID=V6LRM3_9EUKA|nr:hypothetical protein SS50377_27493 [Spironucleus salmonicida]|eukprot:EST46913.1 Hypothetical protein SS50377_13068 [Spironucleus salmonicida]